MIRRVIQKTILYQCSICRTKHPNKKDAIYCNRRIREKKIFKVGDTVSNIKQLVCHKDPGSYFFFDSGKILRVRGPQPADEEYEMKWLGGKKERINSHVFVYEVELSCPYCKEIECIEYYAPELKRADE